jgi:hypothetical protein
MRRQEAALSAALAAGLLAGCSGQEVPPQDPAFTQELPIPVQHHEGDVLQFSTDTKEATAITVRVGATALTITAKHVAPRCESGALLSGEGSRVVTPKTLPTSLDVLLLGVSSPDTQGASVANRQPKVGNKAYFMTYQSDSGTARGPEQPAPFNRPARYSGVVAQVSRTAISYAIPVKEGWYQDPAGASGSAVFAGDGTVESIVSRSKLTPQPAAVINQQLGSRLPAGSYNVLTAVPITPDVMDLYDLSTHAQSC